MPKFTGTILIEINPLNWRNKISKKWTVYILVFLFAQRSYLNELHAIECTVCQTVVWHRCTPSGWRLLKTKINKSNFSQPAFSNSQGVWSGTFWAASIAMSQPITLDLPPPEQIVTDEIPVIGATLKSTATFLGKYCDDLSKVRFRLFANKELGLF